MVSDLQLVAEAVMQGDRDRIVELVQAALDRGFGASQILNDGLLLGMERVGELFRQQELFIPEVMLSANAMRAATDVLRPLLRGSPRAGGERVLLGTVQGDVHDIGKNLVKIMWESAGLEVIDLGVDVAPSRFVDHVAQVRPLLVGISSLLTTTMQRMAETIAALQEAGLRDKVRVMVGGAPVTREFARSIGADGYAPDAASAVERANELLRRCRASQHAS